MFQSKKAKIILAVFLVVVATAIVYLWFWSKNRNQPKPVQPKTTINQDQATGGGGTLPKESPADDNDGSKTTLLPGQSPAPSPPTTPSTIKPIASVTITPYPGSGIFDYTRRSNPVNLQPLLERGLTIKQLQKLQQKDVCGLAEISQSWDSPVEKILCSFIEYTTFKVLDPLNDLICNLITASLKTNFNEGIESKIINGKCQIEDRK